jgi:hypothetical protein
MPKVTELYAFVMADSGESEERVMAVSKGDWMLPLVAADSEHILSLKPFADRLARLAGKPYKLLRFSLSGEGIA